MAKPWNIPRLDVSEDTQHCARQILLIRLRETFSFKKKVLKDNDVDSIHDMRVSARRLQTFLVLFRDFFPKRQYKYNYRVITSIIRHLGKVRTCDVFISMLAAQSTNLPAEEKKTVDFVIACQKTLRDKECKNLVKELNRIESDRFYREFSHFIDEHLICRI